MQALLGALGVWHSTTRKIGGALVLQFFAANNTKIGRGNPIHSENASSFFDREELVMENKQIMTVRESFDLEIREFEQAVMVRYFECQPDRKATDQELENVLVWAHSSRTDGAILDGLLRGDLQVRFDDGQLSCRTFSPTAEPEKNLDDQEFKS